MDGQKYLTNTAENKYTSFKRFFLKGGGLQIKPY